MINHDDLNKAIEPVFENHKQKLKRDADMIEAGDKSFKKVRLSLDAAIKKRKNLNGEIDNFGKYLLKK